MHNIDSSNAHPRITVVVPVCGIADPLPQLYNSLLEQSLKDFLLLVVDDLPVDNCSLTGTVGLWRAQGRMAVRHLHAGKPGRHHAVNKAIEAADSELFMLLDAGDHLVPDALAAIAATWDTITNKERYAGMQCLCRTEGGEIVGTPFKRTDTNNFEMRLIDGIIGEKGIIYQTSKLKSHSLPDCGNDEVPDSILHNRVSRRNLTRCIPQALVVKPQRPPEGSDGQLPSPVSLNVRILQFNELNHFPMPIKLYLTINTQYVKLSLLAGRKPGRVIGEAIRKQPAFPVAMVRGFFEAAQAMALQKAAKRAAG